MVATVNFIVGHSFLLVIVIIIIIGDDCVEGADLKFHPEKNGNGGWIKSCGSPNDKNNLYFQASQCPSKNKGLWIDYQIEAGCICVQGLWVLSADLCDDDMMIVYGKGHCFKSPKKVIFAMNNYTTNDSKLSL